MQLCSACSCAAVGGAVAAFLHDGQRERHEGGHRDESGPEVGGAVAPAENAHDQGRLEEGRQQVEEQQPQQRVHAAHAAREDAGELARRL